MSSAYAALRRRIAKLHFLSAPWDMSTSISMISIEAKNVMVAMIGGPEVLVERVLGCK
jgi:hypothetical protein